MIRARSFLALTALVVATACCPLPSFPAASTFPAPIGLAPETPFEVGTARIDLTPPPGAATWGHGPDSRMGMGHWTRLQCRAFVFVTQDGRPLALVPCDLHSTSNFLHRQVVSEVERIVPGTRVFIASTHTHAGPGHYWEGDAYGGPTSSRSPGFDRSMVDFLGGRIAAGIKTAFEHKQAAKLRLLHHAVWDVSRNRSLGAYHMNTKGWQSSESSPFGPDEPEDHRLVDPALDVIEIRPASGPPTPNGAIGAITFFSMHPTVLSAANRLFGADVYGVTSRAIERELRRSLADRYPECKDACADVDPLAPIVNGNEGDLVPRYEEDSRPEVERVGTKLADYVIDELARTDPPFVERAAIDGRYLEIDMAKAWVTLPDASGASKQVKLCDPSLGQAAMRGGSDHRASTELLLPDSPDTDVESGCAAPKARGLGALQSLIAPPSAYPHWVGLGLVRIGGGLVAFVPGELTMSAGHMIDDAVDEVWRPLVGAPSFVRIGGLTNAYLQYVTTPEEYRFQAYEGASDLYGPHTIDVFVDRFRHLARSLAGHPSKNQPGTYFIDELPKVSFEVAPGRPRLARPEFNVSLDDLDAKNRRGRTSFCRLPGDAPSLCMAWKDGGPGVVPIRDAPWISVVDDASGQPATLCGDPYGKRLGAGCDPRGRLDDWGTEIAVKTTGESCANDGSWQWVMTLSPRARDWDDLAQRGLVRVRVASASGHAAIESPPFSPKNPPPLCNPVEIRRCLKDTAAECTAP